MGKDNKMSIKLMSNILELDLPTPEKFTLLVMADFANDEGKSVYPSQETIAHKTSQSVHTIVNAVARLKQKGYISVVGRRKTTHQYEYILNVEKIHSRSAYMHQVNMSKFTTCTSSISPRELNPLGEPSVEPPGVQTPEPEPFSVEPERVPVIYANNEYHEVDEIKEVKPKHGANYRSLMSAVASVCRMDINIKTQAGQVGKAAKELDVAGYTPEQVYDFLDWWKKFDWRWTKEHRVPAPHELLTNISKTVEEKKPEVTDEYLRSIGYK